MTPQTKILRTFLVIVISLLHVVLFRAVGHARLLPYCAKTNTRRLLSVVSDNTDELTVNTGQTLCVPTCALFREFEQSVCGRPTGVRETNSGS